MLPSEWRAAREEQREKDIDDAIAKVRSAIEDKGINPRYHDEVMRTLREEWPTLWRAIDNLLRVSAQ